MLLRHFLLFAAITLSLHLSPAWGQQSSDASASTPATQKSPARASSGPEQSKISVLCILRSDGKTCAQSPEAGLQNEITLLVYGLKPWLDENKIDPEQLTLYLSEREIVGLHPRAVDRDGGKLVFALERTADSKQAWALFLGPPRLYRNVRVSFGLPKGNPVAGAVGMRLLILMRTWSLVSLGCVLGGLVILLYFAITKDLLRNSGKLTQSAVGPKQRKSFSLAKTQMLFWFAVVFFSFVVIFLVTWDRNISIPGSVLALMGISAATTAGGKYLGDKQAQTKLKAAAASASVASAAAAQSPQTTVAAAAGQVGQPAATPAPAAIGSARPALVTSGAGSQATPAGSAPVDAPDQTAQAAGGELTASPSVGFWKDLISEGTELSLQRIQIVFWTIWLGAMFLRGVWDTLAMPEYDATLLGLMTISSGTYLSSKLPSQQP